MLDWYQIYLAILHNLHKVIEARIVMTAFISESGRTYCHSNSWAKRRAILRVDSRRILNRHSDIDRVFIDRPI